MAFSERADCDRHASLIRNSYADSVLRRTRAIAAVALNPPYVKPGHFYSPLTNQQDVRRALTWRGTPGVDLNEYAQLALAASMQLTLASAAPGPRYRESNDMYGPGDAAVYRAMLDYLRPSTIIEAGSGYSTAVALDEVDANPNIANLALTCIDPYPGRLLKLLKPTDQLTVLRCAIQDVPLDTYDGLSGGDILFIDSSHVVKAGSDVAWLLLHVLPRLAPGVAVHVHDIFWPFTYHPNWLRQRRDWNEAYFLHAFLSGNSEWEILLFASWLWREHSGMVPGPIKNGEPGSIWIRKVQ
jgi:Methyltransferase domain